ncbi:MAG: hypothetical protein NC825_00110 [Candidatus Omnitrophica bacterium]|nr:hypothetical protein [Candidatus Omnitrophota bacterium]
MTKPGNDFPEANRVEIILVHSERADFSYEKAQADQLLNWIFLGRSYIELIRWEKILKNFKRIQTGKLLDEIAFSLKDCYVLWSASFAEKYKNDISWWTSRVWERNTMVSSIFLHLCYVKLLEKIVQDFEGEKLLVVCESSFLMSTLHRHFKQKGFHVVLSDDFYFYHCKEKFILVFRFIKNFLKGIKGLLTRWVFAKTTKRYAKNQWHGSDRNWIIIHTCIDDGCFGKDGKFYDRYFPGLYDWLENNGFGVAIIPWIYNVTMPLKNVYRWFRENEKLFLIPEDFYRISDYFWAFFQFFRRNFRVMNTQFIEDMDITMFIKEEKIRQIMEFETINFLLYYRLFRRLKKKNFQLRQLIDTFENMITEKSQIMSIKKYFPEASITGYQHALILTLLLSYQATKKEHHTGPYPDIIISCSEWTKKILVDNGFDSSRILEGPPLRYQYLFKFKEFSNVFEKQKSILIICPLALDSAVELIIKSFIALNEIVDYYDIVYLKYHPMMNHRQLLKAAKMEKLPEKWVIASGNIEEFLKKAHCVISSTTSAVLEAIVCGIPVVITGRETDLTMNPLGWLQEKEFQPVFDTCEMREIIKRNLSLSDEQRTQLKEKGKHLLDMIFKPVDDQGLKVFASICTEK